MEQTIRLKISHSVNLYKNSIDIGQKIYTFFKPEAHGPQRSPECTAMKAIFSQNTVNVACKKKTFPLPWQLIKFSSLDLIHMVVRGLLKEHYCKAFVNIPKVR